MSCPRFELARRAKMAQSVISAYESGRREPALNRIQQATVLALVEARGLDVVPAGTARAVPFLRQAGGA